MTHRKEGSGLETLVQGRLGALHWLGWLCGPSCNRTPETHRAALGSEQQTLGTECRLGTKWSPFFH